jgi:predicted GNAT family acetyltransferase
MSEHVAMANDTPHVLDNPVWHSLNTNHARFAVGTHLVKRYLPGISIFVAFEGMNDLVRRDLEQVVAPGEVVALAGVDAAKDLPGWTVLVPVTVIQMVCEQPPPVPPSTEEILTLTASDVPEMIDLIKLTQPGPFAQRTIELGHYIGIRKEGRLVSISGERFYPPGYREISAVCTHPDHRGKGYARLLVSTLMQENWAQGVTPFLAVEPDHTAAVKLYESLNFRPRREILALVLTR